MIKNIMLLVILSWVSISYAKHPVAQESLSEVKTYKLEKASPEQEALRSVAGDKIKRKKQGEHKQHSKVKGETSAEVHYWEYSE